MLRFADMTRLDRWGVLPQLVVVAWICDNYLIEAAPWSWAFTTMLRHFMRLDQLWLFLAAPAALLGLVAMRAVLSDGPRRCHLNHCVRNWVPRTSLQLSGASARS